MSVSKEDWHCATCGGNDIRHDAVAKFNSDTEQYEIIAVLDETWCEDCMKKSSGEDMGTPVFGIQ